MGEGACQCLRKNMMAATMSTITMIVPTPINMGGSFLRCRRLAGRSCRSAGLGKAPARRAGRFLLAGWWIRGPGRHRPGRPESGVVWLRPAACRLPGGEAALALSSIMMTAWFRGDDMRSIAGHRPPRVGAGGAGVVSA
jgi:hypothetical protein